jgi:hypothetical protein
MAVLKPRERLVYFRISEDEFRQFSTACEQGGARSVSDLARNAVQRLIADRECKRKYDILEEKMQVLDGLIAAVTEQLQILTANQDRKNGSEIDGFHAPVSSALPNGEQAK